MPCASIRYSLALGLSLSLGTPTFAPSLATATPITPAFTLVQTPQRLVILEPQSQTPLFTFQHSTRDTQGPFAFSPRARVRHDIRGSFQSEALSYPCFGTLPKVQAQAPQMTGSLTQTLTTEHPITLIGTLQGESHCQGEYTLRLSVLPPAEAGAPQRLRLQLSAPQNYAQVRLHLQGNPTMPYYGLGIQPDAQPLMGDYPMIVQEGGIGRGLQPLSTLMNLISPGSAGRHGSSYFPHPVLWSSRGQYYHLKGSALGQWSVHPSSNALQQTPTLTLEVDQHYADITAFYAPTPLRGLQALSAETGRPPLLPNWMHRGALVGMQGGSQKVERVRQALQTRQTPISGFWLQDWVGTRKTAIGSQLWWNWQINTTHYPHWQTLRTSLQTKGQHVLGYINPFLVDVPHTVTHNYYQEAVTKGYFVKDQNGDIYPIQNTDFSAGLLDLSNPEVQTWVKTLIKTELIDHAGFSAWMADYAEALPLDATLFAGDARNYHNAYAATWARLNAEAIQESGCTHCSFFMRAGYNQSPEQIPMAWTGDQMVTWDAQDGFQSSIQGLINSGLSGLPLVHSDAGGYTSIGLPVTGGITRSEELLFRWLETNAFTALLRTHEGNQPERNAQIYDNAKTLSFFDRCARIYAALFDYRSTLVREAHEKGWPVVRALVLHYPADLTAQTLMDQFLLGSDILVAPVFTPGQRHRKVYLPAGNWTHLWSGQQYHSAQNRWVTVPAPLGEPPVFFVSDSAAGQSLRQTLKAQGL